MAVTLRYSQDGIVQNVEEERANCLHNMSKPHRSFHEEVFLMSYCWDFRIHAIVAYLAFREETGSRSPPGKWPSNDVSCFSIGWLILRIYRH